MLNKMTALLNGVAQQNLSPIRAEKIRILIPSSNLLFQFKNIVEPIISQIILLNNQIRRILAHAGQRQKLLHGVSGAENPPQVFGQSDDHCADRPGRAEQAD